MRLKKHRQDVRDLQLIRDDLHIQAIARRYLNLIRLAEEWEGWLLNHGDLVNYDTRTRKRVLKDTKK